MKAACQFCKIITDGLSENTVYRDKDVTAFLDKRPLFFGHLLLVPNRHVATLDDLRHDEILPLFCTAQLLSRAVQRAVEAAGSFVAMNNRVSQSVPHLHIHIVPRNPKDGLRGFFWPRKKYESPAHMQLVSQKIKQAIGKEKKSETSGSQSHDQK